MLRVSPNHSAKGYLDDLAKNSVALQGINEDFRHVSNDYRLVSFYESLRTRIGPTTVVNGPATPVTRGGFWTNGSRTHSWLLKRILLRWGMVEKCLQL